MRILDYRKSYQTLLIYGKRVSVPQTPNLHDCTYFAILLFKSCDVSDSVNINI